MYWKKKDERQNEKQKKTTHGKLSVIIEIRFIYEFWMDVGRIKRNAKLIITAPIETKRKN